jgi:hypothetical protein
MYDKYACCAFSRLLDYLDLSTSVIIFFDQIKYITNHFLN